MHSFRVSYWDVCSNMNPNDCRYCKQEYPSSGRGKLQGTECSQRNLIRFIHAWIYTCTSYGSTQTKKRVIIWFRLKTSNSSKKTVILAGRLNNVHSSCMSSQFDFLGSHLFLGYDDFHGQKQSILAHHSQGWLWQLNSLKMANWSSLFPKAGNENNVAMRSRWPVSYHSWSADLCGLNLFIYSSICKKETFLMLVAAILYVMHILYTQ